MTGVIHIPEGERGHIRVFNLDMRPEQVRFLREPGALAQILGIDDIDLDQKNVNDLAIFGLRPSLRWQIEPDWTLDVSVNYQSIRYDDSQYYHQSLGRDQRALTIQ